MLQEAAERFQQLEDGALRQIAEELVGQDPYLYLRAISPGEPGRRCRRAGASRSQVTSRCGCQLTPLWTRILT